MTASRTTTNRSTSNGSTTNGTTTSRTATSGAASSGTERVAAPPQRPRGRRSTEASGPAASEQVQGPAPRNEVRLGGRLAAPAEERELPSGDRIVTLRVVVARTPATGRRRQALEGPRRATVDTIDVVCWTAATRRTALRLRADDLVEVDGALRRRFFGGATGRQSRYEVEATALRRASGGAPTGT
ncbi:single-stranded DNA-binding protein [Terrabacter sp. NPDC080008]|uniref:single-stranded DNA-binding protein n=1 Tax=Terrabacter sp. NPDC080008 TaxID=3155176 RepID=UPI00344F1A5D